MRVWGRITRDCACDKYVRAHAAMSTRTPLRRSRFWRFWDSSDSPLRRLPLTPQSSRRRQLFADGESDSTSLPASALFEPACDTVFTGQTHRKCTSKSMQIVCRVHNSLEKCLSLWVLWHRGKLGGALQTSYYALENFLLVKGSQLKHHRADVALRKALFSSLARHG